MTRRFQPAARLLVAACLLTALAAPAAAAQLSWYGNGAELGGGGTWNTTSPDWSANGVTFGAWNNSGSNGATFDFGSGGEPGYVNVAVPITAVNLTFNDSGFQLYSSGGNALTLIGSASIDVAAGSQAGISTVLAGSAGMTLSGGGELLLASSNSYTGPTTVSGAYLQLDSAGALTTGNLLIDGGVIELGAGDLALGLGTAAGQLRFTSNGGGFAAANGNYTVNLGSLSGTMTWGSTSFLPGSGATLVLGSPSAQGTIDFQNPINLGAATRTVQVNMGSGTVAVNAKLSGALSGSGGLIVTGDGVLALTASNVYGGGTTLADGVLSVQNAAALGGGGVDLDGGTLQLAVAPGGSNVVSLSADSAVDVSGTTAGTLGNFAAGGNTLYVTGKSTAANAAYRLSLGRGTLGGNPTFNVANNGAGVGTLTLGSLSDDGTARTLTKTGSGMLILAGSATSLVPGTVVIVSGGTLESGNSTALGGFARITVDSGALFSLGASQQVSLLTGPGNVALGGCLLTIGNTDNQTCAFLGVISGGSLAKEGSGTLILSGSNDYRGGTVVDAGTLILASSAALLDGSGLTVGAGASQLFGAALRRSAGERRVCGAGTRRAGAAHRGWNRCGSSGLAEERELRQPRQRRLNGSSLRSALTAQVLIEPVDRALPGQLGRFYVVAGGCGVVVETVNGAGVDVSLVRHAGGFQRLIVFRPGPGKPRILFAMMNEDRRFDFWNISGRRRLAVKGNRGRQIGAHAHG